MALQRKRVFLAIADKAKSVRYTNVGQSASFQNRGYEIPRMHQFHFGFEYTLPWKMTTEVSYVGSRSYKFPVNTNINAI